MSRSVSALAGVASLTDQVCAAELQRKASRKGKGRMGWLFRCVLFLVVIAYVVGRYGSEFHRLLGNATGVVSRAQERSATPQMAEDLNTFNGCGMEGDARSLAVQALDRLKNRYTVPGPNEIDPRITLEGISRTGQRREPLEGQTGRGDPWLRVGCEAGRN
jgi:hypothetical protein